MYLVCKHCGNDRIIITHLFDKYPFYCDECKVYLDKTEVTEYKTLATHYINGNYKSLLVLAQKTHDSSI